MAESRLRALVQAVLRSQEDGIADPEIRDDVRQVQGWRGRIQGHGLLERLLSTPAPDRLTAVGEAVHLQASIDRVARLRAERWRMRVGGEIVAEGRIADADDGVVVHRPDRAGAFAVVTELLDRQGEQLGEGTGRSLLQVVGDQPTYAIDVEVVLARASAIPVLAALRDDGAELFYFDLHEQERTVELRRRLALAGAPEAAVLTHARDNTEVPTLGVDFRAVFLTVTLRRLLGAGVAVAAVVSDREPASIAAYRAGVDAFEELNPARRALSGYLARPPAVHDPSARLDRITRTVVVEGNACTVELDNRRARQRLFQAIEQARRTVHLQWYLVRDGAFSDQLGAHLIRAARRGARVRLLVDALYSVDGVAGSSNAVARGLLAEPAIEVVSATPIETREDLEPRVLKQRDHRKLVIVDQALAFVGGRNAADEYYTGFDEVAITDWTPHARIPWLDAHLELRGPLVAEVERAFVARWIEAGGALPPGGLEGIVTPPPVGPSRARLVLHEGIHDAAAMLAYEGIIDGACEHLWIVNDFPIVPSLQLALRRALGRGVAVRLLTGCAVPRRADGSFFDGPLHREAFEYMTKKRLEPLIRAGAEVWEHVVPPHPLIVCRGGTVRPYVHAKLVTADGRVLSLGSANLDATASYWEREANVIVEDPALVRRVEAQLRHMSSHGRRVDLRSEQWRREGLLRDLASQLWPETLYS